MLYHNVPRFCILCHLVTRMLCCSIILHMPPASPLQPQCYLPMVIDWTPTTGLIPCQTQPGPVHEPWSSLREQKPQEEQLSQGCLRSLFHWGPYVWNMPPLPPVHIWECQPIGIGWTPTTGLVHARFSQNLHMGHGFPPVGIRNMKHRVLWDNCST